MQTITLKINGTFEHAWLPNIHTIPESAIEVSDADFMLLSQNPSSKRYDINTASVVDYVPPFVLDDAKTTKLAEINKKASEALTSLTTLYPRFEIDSWPTQEAEAHAWDANNSAPTPLIDLMVANRPSVDKPTLVSRIIANVADYKALSGVVIGKRQAFEDELNTLSDTATQADIDAIVVTF